MPFSTEDTIQDNFPGKEKEEVLKLWCDSTLILSLRNVPRVFRLRKRRKTSIILIPYIYAKTPNVGFLISHTPFGQLSKIMADLNLLTVVFSFTISLPSQTRKDKISL